MAVAQPFDVPLLPIPLQGVHAPRSVEIKGQGQTVHDYDPVRRNNGYSGHVFSPYFLPYYGGLKNLSGTVGETTLTEAQMPSHTHTFGIGTYGSSAEAKGNTSSKQRTDATGGSQAHTHSLSGVSSEAAGSLPPYYAGQYVIRV